MRHRTPVRDFRRRFEELGFVVVDDVLGPDRLEALRHAVATVEPAPRGRGGVRNLLRRSDAVREVASAAPLLDLAAAALAADVRPVKATLFDKTPAANWKVPWHQDLTISVRERRPVDGYTAWSVKDGVVHVQPPPEVLLRMVALRLHLDDTPEENGALRVVSGSHRFGRLTEGRIDELRASGGAQTCPVGAGGVMLMSPLLLHASSAASSPGHRRVIHVEYASGGLDGGLEWAG